MRCANDLAKAWRRGIFLPHFKDEVAALYDGEIRLVDDQLGKIFSLLKSSGIYDDTIIVVVSDHGEIIFELYENGFYKKGPGHTARYTDALNTGASDFKAGQDFINLRKHPAYRRWLPASILFQRF